MLFNPHILSPETIDFALTVVHDDLKRFLDSGPPTSDYGINWPTEATKRAMLCRNIAAAAGPGTREQWKGLAERFEQSAANPPGLHEYSCGCKVPTFETPRYYDHHCGTCFKNGHTVRRVVYATAVNKGIVAPQACKSAAKCS